MARKAKVNYWESRGGYGCWHKGVQKLLAKGPDDKPNGPTYQAALKAFAALSRQDSGSLYFEELIDVYLEWMRKHRKASTADQRARSLKLAKKELGYRYATSLTLYELETWADRQREVRGWQDSTVTLRLSSVRACLRWGAKKGVIAKNPIGEMELPGYASRGVECVLSPEAEESVIKAANPSTRDIIHFLKETGCRPGEALATEARHYDRQRQVIVLPAKARGEEKTHKNARSGKPRVIYLTKTAVDLVERLCKLWPTGPIFRNTWTRRVGPDKGTRRTWTSKGLAAAFKLLRRRTGIKGLIAYSFRHTYAVRWLRAGKPVAPLAEVLGTSIQMIQKHYGHLAEQQDYLLNLVNQVPAQRLGG